MMDTRNHKRLFLYRSGIAITSALSLGVLASNAYYNSDWIYLAIPISISTIFPSSKAIKNINKYRIWKKYSNYGFTYSFHLISGAKSTYFVNELAKMIMENESQEIIVFESLDYDNNIQKVFVNFKTGLSEEGSWIQLTYMEKIREALFIGHEKGEMKI